LYISANDRPTVLKILVPSAILSYRSCSVHSGKRIRQFNINNYIIINNQWWWFSQWFWRTNATASLTWIVRRVLYCILDRRLINFVKWRKKLHSRIFLMRWDIDILNYYCSPSDCTYGRDMFQGIPPLNFENPSLIS